MATAQSAGYDLLQTGSGASIDLSSMGLGQVPLQGVPIQGSTGSTDTIMHRTQDVPSGGGTVPVELYALSMKSQNSVTFQGQQADVYVTVNNSGGTISTSTLPQPDALSPSTGTVTVRPDGTFDSSITINAQIIFTTAGGNPANSANVIGHQAASPITLSSTNSSWSASAPSGYPSSSTYPSGGFYPRPVHVGPHPVVPSTCNTSPSPSPSPTPRVGSGVKAAAAPTGKATLNNGITFQTECISNVNFTN
ncbi:MAG: hypothetical protein DMG65_10420 [Candidatus Angelobacter sp. Gp1-AA117]|nr:MAG: hypothetical protein DMG65_10420 [Candidatus Angelobacter sp. Gp1-AA117]